MNPGQFWSILQVAYREAGDGTTHDWFVALKKELARLPPPEILRFRRRFDELVRAADKTDLWGAAYLINGGCSDDGFHYFRCWLVGMGQAVYEKALDDPDSLADVLQGEGPCEASLDTAPARAWEEKTGRTAEEFYRELDRLSGHFPAADEGEDWDFDDNDEVRRRFPRLARLYLSESEE
jgi:hypothetical protein